MGHRRSREIRKGVATSGFGQAGLTVYDIERSYAFYSDVARTRGWDQDAALGTNRGADPRAEKSGTGPELIYAAGVDRAPVEFAEITK